MNEELIPIRQLAKEAGIKPNSAYVALKRAGMEIVSKPLKGKKGRPETAVSIEDYKLFMDRYTEGVRLSEPRITQCPKCGLVFQLTDAKYSAAQFAKINALRKEASELERQLARVRLQITEETGRDDTSTA
jgi:hypothetical protein